MLIEFDFTQDLDGKKVSCGYDEVGSFVFRIVDEKGDVFGKSATLSGAIRQMVDILHDNDIRKAFSED